MIERPIPPYKEITAMPIIECGEPLIELLSLSSRLSADYTPERLAFEGLQTPRVILREGAAQRLLDALAQLDERMGFVIFDTYRPPAVQKAWFESELQKRIQQHPEWSFDECMEDTKRWLSPAQTDPTLPPSPHSTGGAIDLGLTMITESGVIPLDMGGAFAQMDEVSWTNSDQISPEGRLNRDILLRVMEDAGFVNYPGEWWHFSYGDQHHAVKTKATHAIYDRCARERT